jgi:hypothetical protein
MISRRLSLHTRTFVVFLALLGSALAGTAAAQVTVPGNYGTVQAAINAVVSGALPDGTTINVQAGTYGEALSIKNTNRSFTVRGVGGSAATVIDAAGRGAPALTIMNASGQVAFRGLTFRHGTSAVEGGGFIIKTSSPALSDCVFELNSAFRGGGGALFTSNATFSGCVIRNNTSSHFGGGLYIVNGSRPVFTGCSILNNSSGNGGAGVGNNGAGGGVFSHDSSPTFRGSKIDNNSSKFAAGGVFHQGIYGSGNGVATLTMEDSEIADNVTVQFSTTDNPAEGGGMHVEDNAVAALTRVRVLRNRANTGGGLNTYRGRYDVVDSVIDSNVAAATTKANTGFGGGVAATSNNPAAPQRPGSIINLTRTLVRNNSAVVTGGGIAVIGDNFSSIRASLSLVGSVVAGNQSQSQGGGILVNRTDASLSNSLILSNSVAGGAQPVGGGMEVTAGSGATIAGTTFAGNSAAAYGGGLFVDNGSNLQMNGSRLYNNSAAAFSGGGLFIGPPNTTGTVQNSIIADNTGYQIVEHLCGVVSYVNNTITPRAGNTDVYSGLSCGTATSVGQFESQGNGRSGNDSDVPRFQHVLAAPAAGTAFTLAWAVGRATAVTIGGVGTFNGSIGTTDVAPPFSTTYSLTATASGPDGGDYGAVTAGVSVVQPPITSRGPAARGDFDGDGRSDTSVFRPTDGTWYLRYATGATSGVQWGGGSDIPVPADYDGDGKTDVAVFRPSDGVWYLIFSSTGAATGVAWGGGGDIPVPADYDGDGRADIVVFRPSEGIWYIRYSSTGTAAGVRWGGQGDVPVPADFDGDGKADIAVFRPGNGVWYVWYSATNTQAGYQWGGGNDVAVPGDYDGDGKADIAVFRRSDGVWYLRYASGATAGVPWGGGADIPVPGDYNGDGKTDIAVFRPSEGTWYLRYSGTGATAGIRWGAAVDIPIPQR